MIRPLIAAAALLALPAAAEPLPGDPEEGLRRARIVCAECHAVERDADDGTYDPTQGEAPRSFTAIAADPKMTELALRVFLQSPHIEMPNFMLTERATDDLVSYVLSRKDAC